MEEQKSRVYTEYARTVDHFHSSAAPMPTRLRISTKQTAEPNCRQESSDGKGMAFKANLFTTSKELETPQKATPVTNTSARDPATGEGMQHGKGPFTRQGVGPPLAPPLAR